MVDAANTQGPRARLRKPARATFPFDPARVPRHPGCYLMKDATGDVIYVGKANDLRRRVASYFRRSSKPHRKGEMITRIRDVEVVLTRNEREALVLESNLIRHHRPSYNSRFTRNGDSYYYIAVTDEAFPRLVPYRKERVNFALQTVDEAAAAALYGPYVGLRLRNRILTAVRDLHPVRACHTMPSRACGRFADGLCPAPCEGRISVDAYREIIRRARRFLRRPPRAALERLREEMTRRAAELAFDEAAGLRDRIRALEHAALPQVVERDDARSIDVLWLGGDGC